MTSNRQDTEASDPIAAPLGPSTPGDSSSVPHTPDLKAEPPGGTPESLSLSSPAKSTPPVHPERNLVGPKIHKHAPKQPIFSSEQRFKDHPEQNTDVIPTSKHLEERWSHNQLAFPVNDASILTFSSRKFPDHDTSDNISPPHDAEFDDDTPDTFPLSRGAPRRRLNNGQPLSPALPKPASSHAQTPPSTNSKFLRPPPLNVGLGTTTRYHPYANAPASEGSIVFHTPSSAPASPRKKRARSSRHDVPSPIISPYTHGYMHAQDAISPYSPRPDPRGLTPIRQHFANHNLGPNETPQSWNPGIDQQSRQLPLPHQPANAPPRCGSDADQNGFLVLLNAITADMVVANTDIIGQLAAAISNMPIQKTLRSHVVYAAMSIPVMQLRDAFSKIAQNALKPFYEPYGKTPPNLPIFQSLGKFTGTKDQHYLDDLLVWDKGRTPQIHVLIALTPCTPQTGMFRLVNGSHGPRRITQTFMNQWDVRDISLRPGDCLIWRGDLTYMVTGGEGGEWAMFTFEWTQIDVDLTT